MNDHPPRGVPVLLYHSIGASGAPGLAPFELTLDVFRDQMEHLAAERYSVVALHDYVRWLHEAETDLPPRPVVITFDDGYRNFADAAAILKEFGYPATMFVSTAYVGRTSDWLPDDRAKAEPMMSWAELADVLEAGIDIGAHAHNHVALDTLRPDAAAREIVVSKRLLEDHLGIPVRSFAYPFGYSNRRVRTAVSHAGCDYACAVKDSLSTRADDPYAIARCFAPASSDMRAFAATLEHGNRRPRPDENLATKAWRVARRVGMGRFPAVNASRG